MTNQVVAWYGSKGKYNFTVFPLGGTNWNSVPGVYIFTKVVNGVWYPVYIGQCASFVERICLQHHKWASIIFHGATHVHALVVNDGEATRRAIEADLLAALDTDCNEVLN